MITNVRFFSKGSAPGRNSAAEISRHELSFAAIQEKALAEAEAAESAAAPAEEPAGKYNPRNCTFAEFCATIKTLTREGKLSSHDILLTTADFTRSFKNNPSFRYYMTSANAAGRRNWVVEFEALANRERQRGNMLGYQRFLERKAIAVKAGELLQGG